jgi:hypothetical protein
MATSAVLAHEKEHVTNNAAEAEREGMKAHSVVAIHSAMCPECGKLYVSGGTTTTTYTSKQSVPGISQESAKGSIVDISV